MSYRPLADLLPRVQATIDGVDADMVMAFLADGVVNFCRETHLLRSVQCIKLEPCQDVYLLTKVQPHERISEILNLRVYSGDVLTDLALDYYVDGNVLHIENPPTSCDKLTLEVEYSLVPKRDADIIPDDIYEDWLEAVIAYALSKLYLITDVEWTSTSLAGQYLSVYNQKVFAARLHKISKHRAVKLKLKPKWGWNR